MARDFVEDRLSFARAHANWYRRKKRNIQLLSKTLRFVAILLLSAGGVVPLLSQAGIHIPAQSGYVLLALGGCSLLADRIFGISAGWARYMLAATDIENSAENFRAKVVEIESRGHSDADVVIVELCREFTEGIGSIVCLETKAWVQDFRNGREELARMTTLRGQ